MVGRIFMLLTGATLLEMALLFKFATLTSWWVTLSVVIVTGFVGAWLLRWNGLRALARIRDDLARGTLPADSVLDGIVILMAGVLLMTPGLITDTLGLLMMSPIFRLPVRNYVKKRVMRAIESGTLKYTTVSSASFYAGPVDTGAYDATPFGTGSFGPPPRRNRADPTVIDMSGDR
jgi:UPF0716 protein FxsA